MANAWTNGVKPYVDRPAAAPIILASAMPMLKKRSGYFCANMHDIVQLDTSASSATIFGSLPISASASPYACLVAIFSAMIQPSNSALR